MNTFNLITTGNFDDCPFPFFGSGLRQPKKVYKIYNDGGHYIATPVLRPYTRKPQDLTFKRNKSDEYTDEQKSVVLRRVMRDKRKQLDENGQKKIKNEIDKIDLTAAGEGKRGSNSALDILFDSLYFQAVKQGLKYKKDNSAMFEYIKSGILKLYDDTPELDGYIADKIKRKLNNLLHRKKRFRRKANLNNWNYFVTFTYDDTKHTAESFKKKLRKCLSNLHTRRGWKYMGVFEAAPDTGRLHFHGLIYVPAGQMLGTITEIQDYSIAQGKMQTRNENKFFAENFGRNDFCEVSKSEMKNGKRAEYIIKYIGKTNERICYSRGIPTEICKEIDGDDILTEMHDFGAKYILFDDTIDWERDIMRYRYNKQMSVIDLLCNPPLSA